MNQKSVKIRAPKVKKRFASTPFTAGVTALQEINLEVQEGEFAALIGSSGCGKSTFLYIVAGFEKATDGEVQIDGHPVINPGPGYCFSEICPFPLV